MLRGIEVAENIHEKHGLLSEFFKMIGVDEDVANIDAEGTPSSSTDHRKEA